MPEVNYPALVLNADFSPVSLCPPSVWDFERTLKNTLKERVTPLEFYDDVLRSPSFEYRPPSVVALRKYVKRPERVAFTRMNIFIRDSFTCQYCNEGFEPRELTFDHVVPRSRGGGTNFENIVACCVACNSKKGDRTDIRPNRIPKTPTPRMVAKAHLSKQKLHASWYDYLYWSGVLDKD